MKILLAIGFVLILGNPLMAQFGEVQNNPENTGFKKKGNLELGLVHSMNICTLLGKDVTISIGVTDTKFTKRTNILSASVGFFGNYYLTDKFTFQFEFLLAVYGASFVLEKTVYQDLWYRKSGSNETYLLMYFKVPLTLNYMITDHFYFQGGGYFAVPIFKSDYDKLGFFGAPDNTYGGMNPVDLGIIGGLGFDTRIVKLGFRYNYGLTNIFKNDKFADYRNSVFEITSNWKLNYKK